MRFRASADIVRLGRAFFFPEPGGRPRRRGSLQHRDRLIQPIPLRNQQFKNISHSNTRLQLPPADLNKPAAERLFSTQEDPS